jgi:hypothetical protein
MSLWIIILIATAGGGALLLWNSVSRAKYASEQMLEKYSEMLAEVRQHKARELAASDEAEDLQQKTAVDLNRPR